MPTVKAFPRNYSPDLAYAPALNFVISVLILRTRPFVAQLSILCCRNQRQPAAASLPVVDALAYRFCCNRRWRHVWKSTHSWTWPRRQRRKVRTRYGRSARSSWSATALNRLRPAIRFRLASPISTGGMKATAAWCGWSTPSAMRSSTPQGMAVHWPARPSPARSFPASTAPAPSFNPASCGWCHRSPRLRIRSGARPFRDRGSFWKKAASNWCCCRR